MNLHPFINKLIPIAIIIFKSCRFVHKDNDGIIYFFANLFIKILFNLVLFDPFKYIDCFIA